VLVVEEGRRRGGERQQMDNDRYLPIQWLS
jgi:hypothetical protein